MNTTLLYSLFLNAGEAFKRYALNVCQFKEDVICKDDLKSNITLSRRPIVCIANEDDHYELQRLITEWSNACASLHESDPDRYPLTMTAMRYQPAIYENVKSAKVFINDATNSRLVQASSFIKRLELALRCSKDVGYNICLQEQLAYFKKYSDEQFRVRSSGYTEVVASLTLDNGEEMRVKVPEYGICLAGSNGHVPVLTKVENKRVRNSIYDRLSAIKLVVQPELDIYHERDVIALKEAHAKAAQPNNENQKG